MKKIFVGTSKMILKVFLRRKIFGDISVEYLGNISGKNLRGVTGEIFVGYFVPCRKDSQKNHSYRSRERGVCHRSEGCRTDSRHR